jgi:hypothetical protein
MFRFIVVTLNFVFYSGAAPAVVLYPGGTYWVGPVQVICQSNESTTSLPVCERTGVEFIKQQCFDKFTEVTNRNNCALAIASARYADIDAAKHCFKFNQPVNVLNCLRAIADRQFDGQAESCFQYRDLTSQLNCLRSFGTWARCI